MWPHLRLPREVGAMAEAQGERWTFRQKWHPSVFLHTWPVVTISHETEDQGIALGRSIAERLGFGYWDRDLVTELARLLNEKSATSMLLDESTRAAIEEFLGTSMASQETVSADYTDLVQRIFDSIAHRGGAVIVGRGAQFLVAPRASLRVRLVAPFDLRARELEIRRGITSKAAKRAIQFGDSESASFAHHAMGHDVTDPAYFDLVVNTETYMHESALSLVLMAYFAKFGRWPLTARGLLAGGLPGLAPALAPMHP
jgi:cytidylate kinase